MLRKLCVAGEAASIIDGNSGKPGKAGLQILLYRADLFPMPGYEWENGGFPWGASTIPSKPMAVRRFPFLPAFLLQGRKDQGRDIVHA